MTKDQEFKQELFALLRKYNAEMYVREYVHTEQVAGVSFQFIGEGDLMLPDVDFDSWEDGKEFV